MDSRAGSGAGSGAGADTRTTTAARGTDPVRAWAALLGAAAAVFTRPGFALFADLLTGWVCAPGRRTNT